MEIRVIVLRYQLVLNLTTYPFLDGRQTDESRVGFVHELIRQLRQRAGMTSSPRYLKPHQDRQQLHSASGSIPRMPLASILEY